MKDENKYIRYGKSSILESTLKGSFEEVKANHPEIKDSLLRGAWELANPAPDKKKKTEPAAEGENASQDKKSDKK